MNRSDGFLNGELCRLLGIDWDGTDYCNDAGAVLDVIHSKRWPFWTRGNGEHEVGIGTGPTFSDVRLARALVYAAIDKLRGEKG